MRQPRPWPIIDSQAGQGQNSERIVRRSRRVGGLRADLWPGASRRLIPGSEGSKLCGASGGASLHPLGAWGYAIDAGHRL